MDNFDREFDELLKNALNNDDDIEGLTMDEDLIASTLSAIEEAAPHSEEIRASFDEGFIVSASEETEPVETVQSAGKAEPAPVEDDVVSLRQAGGRKKSFFTGKNIGMICGAVAGLAAVVLAVVFVNSTSFKKSETMSSSGAAAPVSVTTTETATESKSETFDYMATEKMDSPEAEMSTTNTGSPFMSEDSAPMAVFEATQPAEDGLYYFDDDEDFIDRNSEPRSFLGDVFIVNDKDTYKPILDEIRNVSIGDPVVVDRWTDTSGDMEEAAAGGAGTVEGSGESEAEEDLSETGETEEFDINDPEQLAEALRESKQMLDETGGLPSENAGEVIGSVEIRGETVPDFEYSPEKSTYWVDMEDSSDETFAEYAPLITIYDKDDEADLDICIRVYDNRCVIDDYALDMSTTYTIEDGNTLAEKLRLILPQ